MGRKLTLWREMLFSSTQENRPLSCENKLYCLCNINRIKFSNRAEVEQVVAEYVQFYNFERINLKDGLTPYEIRSKAA